MLRRINRSRSTLVSLVLFTAVAAAGVVGVTFSAGTARADDTSAEAGARHGGRGHHHRHDLLHAALRLPDLTDAQRAQINTLEQGVRASRGPARQAHEALAQAVAAQVDANKIDRSQLKAQLKAVGDADLAVSTARASATTGLHAVLTPAQRTELADSVSAKITEREQKHAAHEAQLAGTDANAKTAGDQAGPWSRALGLSPAQETQIRANLQTAGVVPPARGAFDAQMQRELSDFKSASFTASVQTTGGPPGPGGHMVDLAQAALPVLTNAQRTELSNLLRGSHVEEAN